MGNNYVWVGKVEIYDVEEEKMRKILWKNSVIYCQYNFSYTVKLRYKLKYSGYMPFWGIGGKIRYTKSNVTNYMT